MPRLALVVLILAAVLPARGSATERTGPVVLELFTSQGCSACPPADALLGMLGSRDGIIALAFHVPYWDHMGWRDPFALPVSAQRQRAYARSLKQRSIYTPQLVVQGAAETIGHDRAAVERLIAAAPPIATISVRVLDRTPLAVALRIPAIEGPLIEAQLWVAAYLAHQVVHVTNGENAGHTLHHAFVVRWALPMAQVNAAPADLNLSLPDAEHADGIVVLLHGPRQGPLLAAGRVTLR